MTVENTEGGLLMVAAGFRISILLFQKFFVFVVTVERTPVTVATS
jgi:hypothetical protein